MDIFDYINMVSGYIINTLENKKDMAHSIAFNIVPSRDFDNGRLYYVVEEIQDFNERTFYLKFPCVDKEKFYEALNEVLITYLKNSDLITYSSLRKLNEFDDVFSMICKNRASVSLGIEDEKDLAIFSEFKKYLDVNKTFSVSKQEKIEEEFDEVYLDNFKVKNKSDASLRKILL